MANFTDTTPPLVPGQPDLRKYRAQGMEGNTRVGMGSLNQSLHTQLLLLDMFFYPWKMRSTRIRHWPKKGDAGLVRNPRFRSFGCVRD